MPVVTYLAFLWRHGPVLKGVNDRSLLVAIPSEFAGIAFRAKASEAQEERRDRLRKHREDKDE